MKKTMLFFVFLFTFSAYSQEDAWVYFTGKPNSQYYFDNPLQMLSQRSLDRRTNQNINLNISDVPIHQPYIDQIIASTGIQVKAKSKWLNCVHVRGTVANIQALSNFSFVSQIHFANNSLNAKSTNHVQLSEVNKQLDFQTIFAYGNSSNQIQMLNGHLLHQQNFTGVGKIIAVLDSGFINVNVVQPFQRLFTNNLILGGYNFVSGNANVYTLHDHGTAVLSCMGGYTEGQLVGTAPDAQYYLFVTEDVASENPVEESFWVEAAEEADRLGVDIITSSLGYFAYDNPNYSYSYSDMTGNVAFISQGANIAFTKGIVVVASAGNSGATSEPHVGVPAEATNVLAVGAVKADEIYANFSSIGPSFDNRIKPDVMAQGQNVTLSNSSGNIVTSSGTSFSGPIMAGMIASFWQAVPALSNQQVVNFVKQSADRFSNPNAQYGYGIPDFQMAINSVLLSVTENSKNTFILYPNPVNGNVTISNIEQFTESVFTLYNNLGQVVVTQNIDNPSQNISLENINTGIYFYKIKSNSFTQSGKIIKN
jgi:hypothetical protein